MNIRPAFVSTLFTFSASFAVYLFTLSPTVGLEDSGEFITAVSSLGIAHPSGYPLYVVLGKLFTLLVPFGDIAWRVNLFSAFCASMAVGVLSLLLQELLHHLFIRRAPYEQDRRASKWTYAIAASIALSLGFSRVWWSQAVIAEVYTLNAFFVVLTLFLLWRYWCNRQAAALYVFALVYGLSINNHQTMLLLAPVYLLFLLSAEWKRRRQANNDQFSPRGPRSSLASLDATGHAVRDKLFQSEGTPMRAGGKAYAAAQLAAPSTGAFPSGWPSSAVRKFRFPAYCIAFFLFALGLSFYLFILFRAGQNPLLNWDHPDTLNRLWRHFTRQSYGDLSASLWSNLWTLKKIIYVHFFFIDLVRQLTPVASLLAFIGFLTAWFRARALFLLSFGVFVMNSLAIIFLRKLGYEYEGEQVYRVYYIPAYTIAFLWLGLGAGEAWKQVRDKISPGDRARKRLYACAGAMLLAALPVFLLLQNFSANDKSDFWIARDWGVSVLESLAPDAVLIPFSEQPAADSQIFILAYLTLVEGLRPDIAIVDAGYLSSRFYHAKGPDLEEISRLPLHQFRARLLNRIWSLAQDVRRPVYTLYAVGANALNGDLIGRGNGLAFRVFPNADTARASALPPASLALRNTDDPHYPATAYGQDFLSDISYARAAWYLEQGHFKASEASLIDAFNLDQTPLSANAYDYMAYRARWLGAESSNDKTKSSKE